MNRQRRWRNPGVLVFLGALALAGVGCSLVLQASRRIPVDEATVDGFSIRLEEARWILDQMDHGENFEKPSVMMPDMPDWGRQRVTLSLSVTNAATTARTFDAGEILLVPEIGEPVSPKAAHTGYATLLPGQRLYTTVHFDLDTTRPHGKLRAEWRRDGESAFFSIPEPAQHYHLRPRGGELALPPDARLLLPIGKPDRGEALFREVYGCVACHGDPRVPDSNNVGPHLGRIGTAAAARIDGVSAAQYIYESIIDPGSFIAPECRQGLPCPAPTAMPEYASLVSLEDVADLVTYLLAQSG